MLLLLTAKCIDSTIRPPLEAAAAVELLHVAALYHDDVMDRASERRGGASANAAWSNGVAAVAGDYLVARALSAASNAHPMALGVTTRSVLELCNGQLQEAENAFNLDLAPETHLRIVARKTGTLFELPCQIGGVIAGAGEADAAALRAYGRALGIAFQIVDDALDFSGDAAEMGKRTGTDLREGIYSLPVILALQSPATRAKLQPVLLRRSLADDDLAEAAAMIHSSGAVTRALNIANVYVRQAQANLTSLPQSAERGSLHGLASHVALRSW